MVGTLLPALQAGARPGGVGTKLNDTRHVGTDYNQGRRLPFKGNVKRMAQRAPGRISPSAAPVVGEKKAWLALDDAKGSVYLKNYKLRGIGANIEVWVARDKDKVAQNRFQRG